MASHTISLLHFSPFTPLTPFSPFTLHLTLHLTPLTPFTLCKRFHSSLFTLHLSHLFNSFSFSLLAFRTMTPNGISQDFTLSYVDSEWHLTLFHSFTFHPSSCSLLSVLLPSLSPSISPLSFPLPFFSSQCFHLVRRSSPYSLLALRPLSSLLNAFIRYDDSEWHLKLFHLSLFTFFHPFTLHFTFHFTPFTFRLSHPDHL